MNFIIYENALPILEEYEPEESLRILLSKHDEFDEEIIECNALAGKLFLSNVDDPQLLYACYVNAVAQTRHIADFYAKNTPEIFK